MKDFSTWQHGWKTEKEEKKMNEYEFTDETMQNGLKALITGDYDPEEINWENMRVKTFEEEGVMTYDKGLVITLPDGSEYQITIIRSR